MLQKIRYRLTFNYGNRINKQGKAPVALECRQGTRKMYISSRVVLYPNQWDGRQIINHGNSAKLTAYLIRWRNSIEEIELNALLKGRRMTLHQLKEAVRNGIHSTATVREFAESVIQFSDRKKTTKQSYRYMCNELEREYGRITLEDITIDLIEKWRMKMRSQGLSENTIKGRLKSLRCIMQQARLRDLIDRNPFDYITIGNISARKEHLTMKELNRLSRITLSGKEKHVRDAFLFCCMTGLRFSDFRNLKREHIHNGVITLEQQKTRSMVRIPLKHLFGGRALKILNDYPSVESFARIGHNTTANRTLKDIGKKAGIDKNLHWHLSRHTCGTLLNEYGLKMQEIQQILGHARMETTSSTYAETTTVQLEKSLRKVFKI